MKKILLFFISLFVGIGLLVWIIRFIGWEEIKSAFLIFAGWHGLVILILTALMLFFGVWKWKVILKSQGYDLPNRQLAGTYFAGFSVTYLLPMLFFGGEIFRGYVLKEKFSIPWERAISSVIIDRILEITAYLVTIIAGTIFFLLKIGLPPRNLGIILLGGLIFFSVILGLFYFKSFKRESIARFFINLFNNKRFPNEEPFDIEKEIFKFCKPKKKVLWEGIGLAFLRVIVTWFRCWILVLFLGKSVGIFSALSILGFYYFAIMIPIPMALGSHEVIQTFSFGALGLGANTALAFTMIQRGAELILAFVGIAIFFRLGMRLLQTVLFRKIENFINNRNNQT